MSKILIVEDESSLMQVFKKTFSREGFEVDIANDGEEGLEKARTNHPDVIFLDVLLPKLHGINVLEKLKQDESTKNIPVIVMTNFDNDDNKNRALEIGASEFVVKIKLDIGEFIELARKYLPKTNQNV